MVFWKAPGFSVGTVKPVNMIDEERDACPALLALYHFREIRSFPVFQSENYTYRFLKFGVVLTASSRLRWCVLSSQFLGGSFGAQWLGILLLHPCFNMFSRGFLAASRRNIQGGDFSLFTLCSIAFLTGTNVMFSLLCRRLTFVSARSFEAEKVVAQVGVVGDIAARHIGDGGALVLVNAHDRRCSPKTYRRGHLFIFHDGLYNPDG